MSRVLASRGQRVRAAATRLGKRVAPFVAAAAIALGSQSVQPSAHCRAALPYPDPKCTPGVVNPDVTQANIKQTICVPGWTDTIRPPTNYTTTLKGEQMKEYGFVGDGSAFEEDHFISLELGGHPKDPHNLWPEPALPTPGFRQKDQVETHLKKQVCDGEITLAEAQRRITTDWRKVYDEMHGAASPRPSPTR